MTTIFKKVNGFYSITYRSFEDNNKKKITEGNHMACSIFWNVNKNYFII